MFKFCCEDCGECWYVGNPRTCKCPDEEPQQPKQEQVKPVAWGMETNGLIYDVICPAEHEREEGSYKVPLYTTPPQRTWVGLTSEDMKDERTHNFDFISGARWAEEILKERNI
jgi:hypothetical protein